MEETQATRATSAAIGTTALGRIEMRVPEDDGFEEVVIERRWPDMVAARAWCERTVRRLSSGTTVLEIQVIEESWRHSKSWETTKSRPQAEVLQLGVLNTAGYVRWSEPRAMMPRAGSRHLL
jgi:hypothetical protein